VEVVVAVIRLARVAMNTVAAVNITAAVGTSAAPRRVSEVAPVTTSDVDLSCIRALWLKNRTFLMKLLQMSLILLK